MQIEHDGKTITFPDTAPINLFGEADAYPGETWENAYARLFYVACQCGYMASRCVGANGAEVRVYGGYEWREFRLVFGPDLIFQRAEWRVADDRTSAKEREWKPVA